MCTRRANKKTWHICYFSIEKYTVYFTIYIGPRGGQRNRITVIDDSKQVPDVDRVACWSGSGSGIVGFGIEKLLSYHTLNASEGRTNEEKILNHLRSRAEILLTTPSETIGYILELIEYFKTHPDASSISALEGGATGL